MVVWVVVKNLCCKHNPLLRNQRAKAVKTVTGACESSKTLKKSSRHDKKNPRKSLERNEEMVKLFQSDTNGKKPPRSKSSDAFGRKKVQAQEVGVRITQMNGFLRLALGCLFVS